MLKSALKEWAVATEALARGETILLLRKGGIREVGGRFSIEQSRVWLYPTHEHQQAQLLKPFYADQLQLVEIDWHPEIVTIQAFADITEVFQVSDPNVVSALLPFHVWNEAFVRDRLRWKAREPLYVLLLRVFRLDTPHQVPYRSQYGGCKSWIELEELSTEGAIEVLSDRAYSEQVSAIRAIIAGTGASV
ncbi:DUF1802 family protein [Microcoleus sp. FACHB-1515]|uniref:DUF1802 family protein n=1 Tax=Cyanophyceae TaxID=3028117 RepID=UPI001687A3D4|nr:DUF1802 family protein [Microcoleus sp. FACHB-1515]MBD2092970.1 DUF1802 family protein [Microcoleus sp. FACHB-1515]